MPNLTLMTRLSNPSLKAYMNSQTMNRKSYIGSSTINTIYQCPSWDGDVLVKVVPIADVCCLVFCWLVWMVQVQHQLEGNSLAQVGDILIGIDRELGARHNIPFWRKFYDKS